MSVMCSGERYLRRPYGTPVFVVGPANPTLKRGANNRCAYGATVSTLRKAARKIRGAENPEARVR